jgi:DNA-binding MarR family transcriptional regulator
MMNSNITAFLRLLRELQKIDPEFPLQYAICLAEIAANEGQSLTQLAERTGMPLSTISRIVGALSRHRQRGTPYDLVRVNIAPQERRKKQLFLTARGRAFIGSIADMMGKPAPEQLRA